RVQLVRRVEDGGLGAGVRDPPVHGQRGTGVDAVDPTTTQPDQADRAAAVVQLGLQGRDAAHRAQGQRPDRAGDADLLTAAAVLDRDRAAVAAVLHEVLGLELLARGGDAVEEAPQHAAALALSHGTRLPALPGSGSRAERTSGVLVGR